MKRVLLVLSFVAGCCAPALAQQSVADFYKGKTIRIVVGISVGSGYDVTARALQRHLGQAHSRQSDRDRAEPARRRQPDHGEPARRQRPVRRHRDRRAVQRAAHRAAAAARRRAVRSGEDAVARQHQPRNAGDLSVAHRAGEDVRRDRQDRSGDRRAGRRHDAVGLSAARQRRAQYQVQGHHRLQEHAGHPSRDGARRNPRQRLDQLDDAAVAQRRLGEGEEGQRDRAMGAEEASRPARTCRWCSTSRRTTPTGPRSSC